MKIFNKKNMAVMLAILTFGLCAFGCGSKGNEGSGSEKVVLKLGHVNGTTSPNQITAQKLQELVKQKLPKYEIEIHPSGQLGGERDMIENVQMGSLDMVITATTPLANFVPEMNVGELLYLIKDYKHADAVYQGPIGKKWLDACANANMKGLGYTEVGFRKLCSNKPITSIDDLKGLKLRVMENEMHVAGWRTMGCDAVTMSWPDAYAGVQQGTIDAVEVPYTLIVSNSVDDVCKYIAETNHIYTAQCMLISKNAWDKMSPEEQEIFAECAEEACKEGREYARKEDSASKKKCIDKGVKITEIDAAPFRERAKELYAKYKDKYGKQIEEILALAK